jgi:hypothetical protein
LPESGADLASQPTISRLERMRPTLAAATGSPRRSSSSTSAGAGQGGASGEDPPGFRRDRRPHPRGSGGEPLPRLLRPAHVPSPGLVFDGETGHLIGALLRAGNTHRSHSVVALLKRMSPACAVGDPKRT